MNITIELVEIGAPKRDGKFDKMELVYMRDGKKTERKLVAINKTKEVIQKLQQLLAPVFTQTINQSLLRSLPGRQRCLKPLLPGPAQAYQAITVVLALSQLHQACILQHPQVAP